jgi:hypothetical protein
MKKKYFSPRVIDFFEVGYRQEKRAAKILTSNQQQTLQGLVGTSFVTRGQGYGPAKQGWVCCSQGAEAKEGLKRPHGLI